MVAARRRTRLTRSARGVLRQSLAQARTAVTCGDAAARSCAGKRALSAVGLAAPSAINSHLGGNPGAAHVHDLLGAPCNTAAHLTRADHAAAGDGDVLGTPALAPHRTHRLFHDVSLVVTPEGLAQHHAESKDLSCGVRFIAALKVKAGAVVGLIDGFAVLRIISREGRAA